MKFIGNIIWFIFGGFVSALGFFLGGIILCITIVGIPFGMQAFKYSRLALAPFGKSINLDPFKHIIINLIWFIVIGWWTAIIFVLGGILQCILIITIPFGLQAFKFAKLSLMPFGATVS